MTAGHRWILAQFHYDLIYTHVICNQIKKRYYHKSVHISSHICSQVLHWSELCWKVGKTFLVVYFCVVKENTQFDLIYPLGLVWRGQGARVTDGDMGQRPDPRNKKLSRIKAAHCKHWQTFVDTLILFLLLLLQNNLLSSTCSLILVDLEWDTCNGPDPGWPVSRVSCPPTPNISRTCNNPMMNLNCGADLAALNPAWPWRDAAIRCDTELGRSLELETNLREVWNCIIMKKVPTRAISWG